MPAISPTAVPATTRRLHAIGASIRMRRKHLRVSAATAAEAAGMSRVTLNRIERGEPSVTIGAYLNAMEALGIAVELVVDPAEADADAAPHTETQPPAVIRLADYPQLQRLAWHMPGASEVSPEVAFGLYERNWRHVDVAALESPERELLDRLTRTVGKGHLLV